MRDILARLGEVGPFVGIKAYLRQGAAWRGRPVVDALVLNWIEGELLHPRTGRFSRWRACKLWLRLQLMRRAARQLVFVRHNHYPHATRPADVPPVRRWVDRLERVAGVAATHSRAAAGSGRHYVPHPLYRHGPVQPQAVAPWALPPRYFVMFGVIAPYKRIEEVVLAFPPGQHLVVAGAVGDADYARQVQSLQRPNVQVRLGFVGDAEGLALVAGAQALLIAHADADVIVSGSFFFAASVATPVIAVETPFLRSVHEEFGPALVQPVADIAALAAAAAHFTRAGDGGALAARIEQAFGDEAVARAWQPLLQPARR
ncbi:MAG: hypothetical protein QM750_05450 [Rubrivivax sp.]